MRRRSRQDEELTPVRVRSSIRPVRGVSPPFSGQFCVQIAWSRSEEREGTNMDSRPVRECRRWNYVAFKTQESNKGSAFLSPFRNPRKPENSFQDCLYFKIACARPRERTEGGEERETRTQKERGTYVLVLELSPVDALASHPVVLLKVASLDHEAWLLFCPGGVSRERQS